jgi:hypothetical protein
MRRDIKPENFLLTSKDDDAELKAADFGLCTYFKMHEVFDRYLRMPVLLAHTNVQGCTPAGLLTDIMMLGSVAASLVQRTMWPQRCSGATTPGMQTWVATLHAIWVLQFLGANVVTSEPGDCPLPGCCLAADVEPGRHSVHPPQRHAALLRRHRGAMRVKQRAWQVAAAWHVGCHLMCPSGECPVHVGRAGGHLQDDPAGPGGSGDAAMA